MSKEFEEYEKRLGYYSSSIIELEDAFRAGRALGRRDMKGECQAVALEMAADEYTDWNPSDVCQAIEAIPEEV